MVTLKTKDETAKMREAGRIVAEVLASCRAAVRPGVTTGELDKIAADILKRRGATSNFKGYGVPVLPPFPGVICTSVNEQVVHGIPGKRKLKSGDIIAIDAGAIVDGAETRTLADRWTVVTADSSLSAHFEHSLWCTVAGPVVLTAPQGKAAVAA